MPLAEASQSAPPDPFCAGPFPWLQSILPRGRDAKHRAYLHALIAMAVAWVPLALLTTAEGYALSVNPRESFLFDISAHGRYLVALPLFVIAGYLSYPELAAVVRLFVDAEIVRERDIPRYQALVASTRRLLASRWTAAVLVLAAYTSTLVLSRLIYPSSLSTWTAPVVNGHSHLSLAGWWRTLISQPLFQLLGAIWVWRVLLWARFLWSIVHMDLRLIASHSDRLGGLRFVLIPLRGFTLLAFAVGAIVASSVAENVIIDGVPPGQFKYLIGAQVLFVLVLFAGR